MAKALLRDALASGREASIVIAAARDEAGEVGASRTLSSVALAESFERDGLPVPQLRPFRWVRLDAREAKRMFPYTRFDFGPYQSINVAADWGWNFEDCDAWIVCNDPTVGPIAQFKPSFVYFAESSQRHKPSLLTLRGVSNDPASDLAYAVNVRRAAGVIASETILSDDICSLLGIWHHKTVLIDPLLPEAGVGVASLPQRALDAEARARVSVLLHTLDRQDLAVLAEAIGALSERGVPIDWRFAVDRSVIAASAPHLATFVDWMRPLGIVPPSDDLIVGLHSVSDLRRFVAESEAIVSFDATPGEDEALLLAAAVGRVSVVPDLPHRHAVATGFGARVSTYQYGHCSSLVSAIADALAHGRSHGSAAARAVYRSEERRGGMQALLGRIVEFENLDRDIHV
ncbi:hypothetical protein [Methyloraptor flagellatus]|uniref:Glycosyltransferase family 1 protein n=1 Tax=Methyloraptor flagellatus TaxID=3162530 RepID=A0AAU7X9I4_9HYPH